ncbi:MAG: pilus assembly protein TadD [Bacteroidetes bacterium]|nr:pilus assembly protein TadD [Bacteroidota bacterium]
MALSSYASLTDTVKYVGMQACKQCHESIYNTYIETGMGQSFDIASVHKSKASFTNSTIYDKHKNFYYHSYWQGDSLKFMEYRMDGKDTIHKRVETIHYIVGSGQHTNSHMTNTNGYFNQAPMTYYTQKGIWDLPPGFEDGNNSRFSREIGLECMSCHNSFPDFVPGSQNKYTNVPNGITCERCHGPGAMHVREKIAGNIVDINSQIDYTIVNPAKLPIDKQFDVCQRCHIQGNAVLNEGKSFFDFKPGMSLSEVMNVFMPVYSNSNKHIMASHAERLKQSKCYLVSMQKSESSATKNNLKPYKDALTCVTCHDPHVSVRKTEKDFFNKKCIACHSGKETVCTADKIELSKKNNNCVSCHMQTSGATDIPHVSVHDHRISVPLNEQDKNEIKKFVTIACINNPHVDKRTTGKAFIAYYEKFALGKEMLDSAKKYLPGATHADIKTNFHELVHLAYLQDDYNELQRLLNAYKENLTILRLKSADNHHAYTAYRIAQMLETANPQQAFWLLQACGRACP